ncbi:hypothetical protein ACFOWM_13460 [Ferruginibacter yonginensis]|uniref:tRNA_anti-like n=1 Tax=Ferruginibacter yonginensis TaxID=1310416 RepID=A0ABV8QUM7_9BACT
MSNKKSIVKKILIAGVILLAIGGGAAWYILTKKFDDTATIKAAYTVTSSELIKEFTANTAAANKKYSEQIITVNGPITSIEQADTTLNVKMEDSTGAYIIFAFQQKDIADVKKLKEGDQVSIKGSCNGGTFSAILETVYIGLKRCSLNK